MDAGDVRVLECVTMGDVSALTSLLDDCHSRGYFVSNPEDAMDLVTPTPSRNAKGMTADREMIFHFRCVLWQSEIPRISYWCGIDRQAPLLHVAVENGQEEMFQYLIDLHPEMIRYCVRFRYLVFNSENSLVGG